jgi:acetate---CoA ligase (ADP-forming)
MTRTAPQYDLIGRPLALRHVDWRALFSPARAAFIGATDRDGSQQRAQWVFLRDRLEPRGCEVIPVHPSKKEILGTPAVASVLDIDGEVDVAVILVRDPLPALQDCVQKGVRFVIVFSAGFSELGTAEGRQAEAALTALAQGKTRVIGPNTNLNIFEPWRQDLPGRRLAIVTQSGFQGRPISQGQAYGIPISSWATLGNEADLEWADFVNHYVGVSDVGAVVSYVEGFKNGRTLMLAADAAARNGVPIVAIKVGRSQEGRAMAQAHTGHLTGSDTVHDAAFEQSGIVRVDDIDEAIEISGMFCHVPRLTGNDGLALYTLSGGTAAHLADLCGAAGVPVPRFEDRTVKALAEHIPGILRIDNPVDSGGTLTSTPSGRATLEIVLDDENVNMLMVPITGVFPGLVEPLAKDLVELHELGRKPVLVVWVSPDRDSEGHRMLCRHGVPLFHSLSSAVRGASALLWRRRFEEDYQSPFGLLPAAPTATTRSARAKLRSAKQLDEWEALTLLRGYGIPVVEGQPVTSAAEAIRAVESLGGPAVLKILSPDIVHKSDLGLVCVGVTPAEAGDTYRQLIDAAARQAAGAQVRGALVQPMVTDAVTEVIVGISQQEPFGPVVMFGLGGVSVEVFADVAFGVPPFTRTWAERMVTRIKAAPLLTGARGRPPGDVPALVDVVMNVQRLACEVGDEIAELDINPLMVLPAGRGVVAVDALVVPSNAVLAAKGT